MGLDRFKTQFNVIAVVVVSCFQIMVKVKNILAMTIAATVVKVTVKPATIIALIVVVFVLATKMMVTSLAKYSVLEQHMA